MHPPKATCALFFRNGRASGELLPALVGSLPGGREALAAGSPPPRGGGLGWPRAVHDRRVQQAFEKPLHVSHWC